jgi:uncharacterized damage-inducible protein DinB
MTLRNYLDYVDYMVKTTAVLFKQVPPDRIDWKPMERSFTIGQQLAHMVGAFDVYARGITKGEWGFASIRERFLQNRHTPSVTVEEALRLLEENHQRFRTAIGALTQEEFDNGEIETPQLAAKVPRWRAGMLMIEHHLNHKTELFMYLKLLDVKVNSAHLYRAE